MTGVPFGPGNAVGIVAPWFVAVIESERGERLGNALIELSRLPAGGVDELGDVLAQMSLRDLPDFAMGVVELHVVRVLVRGAMAAAVERNSEVEVLRGDGYRTWREVSVERPAEVRIGVTDALSEPAFYWTTGGVAPVSSILVASAVTGADLRAIPTEMPPGPHRSVPDDAPAEPEPVVEIAEPEPVLEQEPVVEMPEPEPEPEPEQEPVIEMPEPAPVVSEHSDQTLVAADDWAGAPAAATPPPYAGVGGDPSDDDPYADLWLTKARSVEDAAVRSGESGGESAGESGVEAEEVALLTLGSDGALDGDHDGHTRAVESLVGLAPGDALIDADSSQGVPSSPCVNGHANPPFAVTCRRCLAPVRDTVERVQRADAGVLVLPNGDRVEVDRTIVLGRNPRADGIFAGDPPRLVGLAGHHDISRTHVVIELSGWTATVTDQDSLNGTEVQLPGKQPEQLRPHVPMAIVVGTRIVLANEVTLKLEGG